MFYCFSPAWQFSNLHQNWEQIKCLNSRKCLRLVASQGAVLNISFYLYFSWLYLLLLMKDIISFVKMQLLGKICHPGLYVHGCKIPDSLEFMSNWGFHSALIMSCVYFNTRPFCPPWSNKSELYSGNCTLKRLLEIWTPIQLQQSLFDTEILHT